MQQFRVSSSNKCYRFCSPRKSTLLIPFLRIITVQGIFKGIFRHNEEIPNHFFIKILYAYRRRAIMKLSITGVKQPMQLKTNRKKNVKTIHQLYSSNFQGKYTIIINDRYNAETQRHLQVFLLLFKKYRQAVEPAYTETEGNDLTADNDCCQFPAPLWRDCTGRKRPLKRRCISSLDSKLTA